MLIYLSMQYHSIIPFRKVGENPQSFFLSSNSNQTQPHY